MVFYVLGAGEIFAGILYAFDFWLLHARHHSIKPIMNDQDIQTNKTDTMVATISLKYYKDHANTKYTSDTTKHVTVL